SGAAPSETIARGQCFGRSPRQPPHRSARGHAGSRAAVDGHGTIVVVARDDLWPCDGAKGGDGLQGHHRARGIADVDVPQVRHVAPVLSLALQIDLPHATENVEIVYEVAAQRGLEGGEHIVEGNAQRRSFFAINVEIERGRPGAVSREYAGETGILIGCGKEPLYHARYRGRVGAFETFELVFEAAAGTKTLNRRQVVGNNTCGEDFRGSPERLRDQSLRGIAHFLSVLERSQSDHHQCAVAG